MGGETHSKIAASLALALFVAGACALTPPAAELPSPVPTPESSAAPTSSPISTVRPRPRFFVASESTEQVWVLEGDPLAVVAKVPVGKLPHNLSVSPDGRWVAVANRMGNTASIINPREMREVARVLVGKQPHDLIWAPDSRTLFVGSEREGYIHRIEADTWKPLAPLAVTVPQHALAIWNGRPNELWFTVTNASAANVLRVYDLDTNQIAEIKVNDVHDVFFTPDGSEAWTTSSGFLCKPSDRVVVYDPLEKRVKEELHFPGRYPFHTMKQNRDALFYVDQTETMVLSDHQQESLMVVDWKSRRIVGSAKLKDPAISSSGACGIEVFHTAYTPGRYYTTSNKDSSLRVIDAKELRVLQRVEIPRPHGVVLVPLEA